MPVNGASNVPPGPLLTGGIRKKTRKLQKAPKVLKGAKWPKGSIVYICGATKMSFSPSDKDLGGSEQAVVNLSEEWAKEGRLVVVYGSVTECISKGVEYRSIHRLNLGDTFDCAIFWRSFGIRLLPLIKARVRLIDLHDSWDPRSYVSPTQIIDLADMVMVKSDYHKSLYPWLPASKMKVVMNGIQVDLFNKVADSVPESDRDPHRVIYASYYSRGLEPILKYTWPKIKAAIPDATFDIYYGMNGLSKDLINKLTELFKQPGVTEHGRISLEEVAKEKSKSAIHLYISNSETEIDCISIRESLVCGAVPVIGNDYVFKERDGVHITGSTENTSTYRKAASTVINLLKDQEKLSSLREEFKKSPTVISWPSVAKEWLKVIDA